MKTLFIFLQYVVPQHLCSRIAGSIAACRWLWLKNLLIRLFIQIYKVDMSEAVVTNVAAFRNFNEFFTRQLTPNARQICAATDALASPVDGAVSKVGAINRDILIQAKGRDYSLVNLLGGSAELAQYFLDGSFITLYLSPKDYHRVHCPLDGKLIRSQYIPGTLFSVNETTVTRVPELFARNERLIMLLDSAYGKVAVIMVGAMIVAGIKTVWHKSAYQAHSSFTDKLQDPISFKKGDELGQFQLGSTVILLFQSGNIIWQEEIAEQHPVKLGDRLASLKPSRE